VSIVYLNESHSPLPSTLEINEAPWAFHRKLPDYEPTPLVPTPALAQSLGVGELLVKDESRRFGMPSFKLLGASWATYRALTEQYGVDDADWADIPELRARCEALRPFTLAAATDGNHGRAVARMAALLGFECRVFVPQGTARARICAIESEGASCTVVEGDYDAAVARSAEEAGPQTLVVDDTSWPGYEEIPRFVIEGYATIFYEIEAQLTGAVDTVVVPLGVGALGAAAVDFFKRKTSARVIGVEPLSCACVLQSIRAGEVTTVPGPHPSIMAGLNCGTPSPIAFPTLAAGLDALVAIEDSFAEQSMRSLAAAGITSGETGAAALGGLSAAMASSTELGIGRDSHVVVLSTEGATDPESYRRIVTDAR